MNADKLAEILRKHDLWLEGQEGGERADLRSANLCYANLSYANLCYANLSYANLRYANLRSANLIYANLSENQMEFATGNMSNIKTIQVGVYAVTYTAKVMQIGCQQHDIKDWWKFDDETIDNMERGTSLDWWKVWKPILKKIIKASPAEPTGFVEAEKTEAA